MGIAGLHAADVLEAAKHRHLYVWGDALVEDVAGERVLPTGDHLVLLYFVEGEGNGLFVGYGPDAEHFLQVVGLADDFHLHAVHQVDG